MRKIKFRCFFYDGKDYSTGEMIPVNMAISENYVEWDEFELKPTDECTILMQYTGINDKNGKEIFEGDIVRGEGQREKYIQIIEFHNSEQTCGRGWIGRNIIQEENVVFHTDRKKIDDVFSYFCYPTTWEVIGNIYENPSLISN